MNTENRINEIFDGLVKSGSSFKDIEKAKREVLTIIKRDEGISLFGDRVEALTLDFLNKENEFGVSPITGISTGIYLYDKNSGSYFLNVIGGNASRYSDRKVSEDTVFDIASVTKLFTLTLLFKLEEEGLINLDDKIADVNPDYAKGINNEGEVIGLKDFAFNDLIRLCGVINTPVRVMIIEMKTHILI